MAGNLETQVQEIGTILDRSAETGQAMVQNSLSRALSGLLFLAGLFFLNFTSRVIFSPLLPVIEQEMGIFKQVIFGIWKYIYHRTPFKYTPLYWGMVFPLGMYTACTIKLSQALQIPFIMNIPNYFIYIAYLGWSIIFISMIIAMLKAATEKVVTTT